MSQTVFCVSANITLFTLIQCSAIGIIRRCRNRCQRRTGMINFNTIPFDPRPPHRASGLRVGLPAATTCGMKEVDVAEVGRLMVRALQNREDAAILKSVRDDMGSMAAEFAPYPPEFRQRMVELIRAGRNPEELGKEFEPSAQTIRNWPQLQAWVSRWARSARAERNLRWINECFKPQQICFTSLGCLWYC